MKNRKCSKRQKFSIRITIDGELRYITCPRKRSRGEIDGSFENTILRRHKLV